jgi:ABC-type transport system involved in cytochrome bd biosynthesis fused ATPase/permease subunit
MSSPIESDDDGLLRDLTRESWRSFVAMPRWAQAVLVLGMVVHLAAVATPPHVLPHAVLASIRVGAFVAIIVGLVENAKYFDEFYMRVYLDACTMAFIASSVVLFAASNFGFDFGIRVVSVLAGTFVLGFVVAFARLRRRA